MLFLHDENKLVFDEMIVFTFLNQHMVLSGLSAHWNNSLQVEHFIAIGHIIPLPLLAISKKGLEL